MRVTLNLTPHTLVAPEITIAIQAEQNKSLSIYANPHTFTPSDFDKEHFEELRLIPNPPRYVPLSELAPILTLQGRIMRVDANIPVETCILDPNEGITIGVKSRAGNIATNLETTESYFDVDSIALFNPNDKPTNKVIVVVSEEVQT